MVGAEVGDLAAEIALGIAVTLPVVRIVRLAMAGRAMRVLMTCKAARRRLSARDFTTPLCVRRPVPSARFF